jgi:hypothetical protein
VSSDPTLPALVPRPQGRQVRHSPSRSLRFRAALARRGVQFRSRLCRSLCAGPTGRRAKGDGMFDELERLGEDGHLLDLLTHYAEAGAADREAWQDRVMQWESVQPRELARLHGELIAYGWLEQNTGVTAVLKPGVAAACYRITSAGLRALKQARRQGREAVEAEAA